jgi:hypothetical protein
LFELCRTEQKSAKLKPAKELAYPNARQTEKPVLSKAEGMQQK